MVHSGPLAGGALSFGVPEGLVLSGMYLDDIIIRAR